MKRKDLITKTSQISEVEIDDCEKVIKALEKILEDEFSTSQGLSGAFELFCKLIKIFKIKMI